MLVLLQCSSFCTVTCLVSLEVSGTSLRLMVEVTLILISQLVMSWNHWTMALFPPQALQIFLALKY